MTNFSFGRIPLAFVFAGLVLLPACTVKYTYLKRDYKNNEQKWLKRLALAVDATGEGGIPSGVSGRTEQRLFLAMESDYLSHHRQYIILRTIPEARRADLKRYCAGDSSLDGILFAEFLRMGRAKKEVVELAIRSSLYDCRYGARVWEALGEKSFPEDQKGTADLVDSYVNRWGEGVRPYVVPNYLMIRKLLASMPDPLLNESDLEAKIDADAMGPVEGIGGSP